MSRIPPLAIAGLLTNATIWGLSWIAFKSLQGQGLHPLWSTAVIYGFSFLVISVVRFAALKELLATPVLWWIVLASGLTNASFNTAVATGDVVRVVLLFYLMPVWSVLLAGPLLGEHMTRRSVLRVAVGLAGAMLVLYQPGAGMPVPRSLVELAAVVGGASFALNNVLLRKYGQASEISRTLAMFAGGCLLAALAAAALSAANLIAWPAVLQSHAQSLAPTLLFWGVLFLLANTALQYGVVRVPANITAVVMLSEILVASISAWWLGSAEIRLQDIAGGLLIIAAPWLVRERASEAAS